MISDLTAFGVLLTKLIREHARILKVVERGDSGRAQLCRSAREHVEKLAFKVAPVGELDRQLPSATRPRVDLVEQRTVFVLHPPDRGDAVLPVVTFRCDFDNRPTLCRLYTALYFLRPGGEGDSRLNIIGLRYDTPEGFGVGVHDMFHLQFINGFRKDGPFQDEKIDTLRFPAKQPSVPLDACDPVTLLISLLVSIYGLDYLEEIVRIDAGAKPFIQKMMCWQMRNQLRDQGKMDGV